MQSSFAQPNSNFLSRDAVRSIVAALAPDAAAGPVEIEHTDVHSNDVTVARLQDGRALMIKQGRYDWSAQRFDTSRRASALLRAAGIAAPAPLEVPEGLSGRPLEVYWRIDLPTLEDLWPHLDEDAREAALRSLGELARRIHRVRLPGFGSLEQAESAGEPLAALVEADLAGRLLPAVYGEWPEGAALVERLLRATRDLARRTADRKPSLLHNDLHLGNVLCESDGTTIRCTGLLDLEAAAAGVPESDLAILQVLHGPLFNRPLPGAWFPQVQSGHAAQLDPWVLCFFRVYHLLNLGFYSALVGHDLHARDVGVEARRELGSLDADARPVMVAVA